MSTASRATLAASTCLAIGTVIFVHYAQQAEKAAMHAGVTRDMEQQRIRRERQADFDLQRSMEEQYRTVQPVHDGASASAKPIK